MSMEHASPRIESRAQTHAHYGSVSLVKRGMQTAFHHPHSTASTSMDAFGTLVPCHERRECRLLDAVADGESAALTTDLSFLRGGKQYRSRDRISRCVDERLGPFEELLPQLTVVPASFLDHSSFGIALDALLALLALIYVGAYIANTYLPDTHVRSPHRDA
ncbi:hypothetical protein PINS_up014602 [Pythium insidiosum]|nr:hypothetical protein PINS_up014602 [Pythium insidiosum]